MWKKPACVPRADFRTSRLKAPDAEGALGAFLRQTAGLGNRRGPFLSAAAELAFGAQHAVSCLALFTADTPHVESVLMEFGLIGVRPTRPPRVRPGSRRMTGLGGGHAQCARSTRFTHGRP